MKRYLSVVIYFGILFIPSHLSVVHAAIVQCSGATCQACDLVQLGNDIIEFVIKMSVIIATILLAYAGFLIVTAQGDMGKIKQARAMFTDIVIGIIIVLSGWLIVNTVMRFLVPDNLLGGGAWYEVKCVPQPQIGQSGTGGSTPGVQGPGVGVVPTPRGDIGAAAEAYTNSGASTAAGPGDGRLACAWAVNKVLENAGVPPIDGNSVALMETNLINGRGTAISQGSAGPGDIVIEANKGHVGICANVGCTQVVSNSSSNKSFTWKSGTDFAPSYGNGPGRIYRVNQ
jgi:hypothetical protein